MSAHRQCSGAHGRAGVPAGSLAEAGQRLGPRRSWGGRDPARATERLCRVFAALQRTGGGPCGPLAGVGTLRGVELMSAAGFNLRISPSVTQRLRENRSVSAEAALDKHHRFRMLKKETTRTVSILETQGNLRSLVSGFHKHWSADGVLHTSLGLRSTW